jgi:membrane associated rhomboid family serine protease
LNVAVYVSAVREKLLARGFADLAIPADLSARVALAVTRTEDWGLLVLGLVNPEAAGDSAGREALVRAIAAWTRDLARREGAPCYFIPVFPFDRKVPEDEAGAIMGLRQEDPAQRSGVVPWIADLAVELVDRHSGFPRVGPEVTQALTDVPRGRTEEAWRAMTGPQIGRRAPGLAINLGYVPATRFILAATVAYYLWVALISGGGLAMILSGPSGGTLIKWGSNYSPLVFQGQQWRLFTHVLLHGGLLHIGLNMWALWQLGRHVELIFGSQRMGYIYVVAGVAGGFASVVLRPGGVNSVGASGAIMGLMGAMVYFALALPGRRVDWRNLLGPVGINLMLGFFIPGIDNYAHFGGFIGGILAAFLTGIPGERSPWRLWAMGAVGLAVILILAGLIPLQHAGL